MPIKTGLRDFSFGKADDLMAAHAAGWEAGNALSAQYDVTGDGQRFLISTAAEPPPISVMLNWKNALRRTPRKDRGRVVNARFAAMAAHYLFEPDFCNVASGWEKGRVEKGVQDARRRIWQEATQARFGSFAELNAWLATQCLAAWDAPHPELPGVTIRDAWMQERPQLMPMPTPFDGYVEVPARVSRRIGRIRHGFQKTRYPTARYSPPDTAGWSAAQVLDHAWALVR